MGTLLRCRLHRNTPPPPGDLTSGHSGVSVVAGQSCNNEMFFAKVADRWRVYPPYARSQGCPNC